MESETIYVYPWSYIFLNLFIRGLIFLISIIIESFCIIISYDQLSRLKWNISKDTVMRVYSQFIFIFNVAFHSYLCFVNLKRIQCISECAPGFYGVECMDICDCSDGLICDPEEGCIVLTPAQKLTIIHSAIYTLIIALVILITVSIVYCCKQKTLLKKSDYSGKVTWCTIICFFLSPL